MSRTARQQVSISIEAPIEVVWAVFIDVERWPTWTKSVTSVELLDGPMRLGASARIRQPKLPKVVWRVTELDPGRSWTWVARSPGASTVATHHLTASADGTTTIAEQSIVASGLVGRIVARLYRTLTKQYLDMEGEGLKRRSEQVAAGTDVDATR